MNNELQRLHFPMSHLKDKIFELRDHWTPRLGKLPFWTLGLASYKDFSHPQYYELADESNRLLCEAFPSFYLDQLEFFSEMLKAPVRYMPKMSIPGFHIFESCPEFTEQMARPHVDVPFNNYKWGAQMTMDSVFTHAIAVELPKSGASMRSWFGVTVEDLARDGIERCLERLKTEPSELVEHKVDQMLFHSGAFFHQISPFKEYVPNEWRITLQSHAIKLDGVWNLYW